MGKSKATTSCFTRELSCAEERTEREREGGGKGGESHGTGTQAEVGALIPLATSLRTEFSDHLLAFRENHVRVRCGCGSSGKHPTAHGLSKRGPSLLVGSRLTPFDASPLPH